MRILIVYRITSYNSENIYDLPRTFKPSLDSVLRLKKQKNWKVDIFMFNYHKYKPDDPLKFSWIYESMPTFLDNARKVALLGNYDAMLFVEPDIILPQDALIRFFSGCPAWDIMAGIYPERPSKIGNWTNRGGQPPNGWLVCMPWNQNPEAERAIAQRRLFKLTGCAGFGCIMLKRKALKLVQFPSRDTADNGPDFGFYQDARKRNLNILCNPNIKCKHIESDGTIIEGPK